jgi:hypothetical protein
VVCSTAAKVGLLRRVFPALRTTGGKTCMTKTGVVTYRARAS